MRGFESFSIRTTNLYSVLYTFGCVSCETDASVKRNRKLNVLVFTLLHRVKVSLHRQTLTRRLGSTLHVTVYVRGIAQLVE